MKSTFHYRADIFHKMRLYNVYDRLHQLVLQSVGTIAHQMVACMASQILWDVKDITKPIPRN